MGEKKKTVFILFYFSIAMVALHRVGIFGPKDRK